MSRRSNNFHPWDERKYKCSSCVKKFKAISGMLKHLQMVHGRDPTEHIRCPGCGDKMHVKEGVHGPYMSCVKGVTCDYSVRLDHHGNPVGQPADKRTRDARKLAHDVFDALWKTKADPRSRKSCRSSCYIWMARQMDLSREECHIGLFCESQCSFLIALVRVQTCCNCLKRFDTQIAMRDHLNVSHSTECRHE